MSQNLKKNDSNVHKMWTKITSNSQIFTTFLISLIIDNSL